MTSLEVDCISEYDFDSSDEEDVRNTVGNIPIQWYDNLAHIGYDTSGRPIMKPGVFMEKSDAIDAFLATTSATHGGSDSKWRTVTDPLTGQAVILSDKDIDIVTKMAKGRGILSENEESPYKEWNEFFSSKTELMPISAAPPTKRTFLPSMSDKRRISRMVHAIKMGRIKLNLPSWAVSDIDNQEELSRFANYMSSGNTAAIDSDEDEDLLGFPASMTGSYVFPDVWDGNQTKKHDVNDPWWHTLPPSLRGERPERPKPYLRPAQEPLPGHSSSYNPAPEFLLNEEEKEKVIERWQDQKAEGLCNKSKPLIPEKFDCLRHVPFSHSYLYEREQRVRDLVMATRFEKQMVDVTPDAILPKIPSLSELRPYPSKLGLIYCGHTGRVTSVSLSPCGNWLASASPADGTVRIWEVATNYCFRVYPLVKPTKESLIVSSEVEDGEYSLERPIAIVKWNPNSRYHLISAAFGKRVFIINPALGDRLLVQQSAKFLADSWSNFNLATNKIDKESDISGDSVSVGKKRTKTTEINLTIDEEDEQAFDPVNDFQDEDFVPVMKKAKKDVMPSYGGLLGANWSYHAPPSTFRLSNPRSHPRSILFGQNCVKNKNRSPRRLGCMSKQFELGRIMINLEQPVIDLCWHPNGDYILTLTRPILTAQIKSKNVHRLLLHRVSRIISQSPFTQESLDFTTEEWRHASFHPEGKPILYVATASNCRIFDLIALKELRCLRLEGTAKDRLSALALHSSGEHFILGTFDGKFNWFDQELGNIAYKKLTLNHGAVRQISLHRNRPLTSCAFDDGTLLILHSNVPKDDLLGKPLIIPVQLIRTTNMENPVALNENQLETGVTREKRKNLASVYSTIFHNFLANVYAGLADGTVRQFVPWH